MVRMRSLCILAQATWGVEFLPVLQWQCRESVFLGICSFIWVVASLWDPVSGSLMVVVLQEHLISMVVMLISEPISCSHLSDWCSSWPTDTKGMMGHLGKMGTGGSRTFFLLSGKWHSGRWSFCEYSCTDFAQRA